MIARYPHNTSTYPQRKRITSDLLINYSEVESFITLGRSALSAQEFVRRAKRYTLTYEQQRIVERVKLQGWNEWAKEKAG